MKTITQFSGFQINEAVQKHKALIGEGKTPEETAQSLGEQYKLEGDKLKYFLHAIDLTKEKGQGLKRVLLFTLNEGEKAPQGAVEKDGHQYLCEYFYVPSAKRERGDGKRFGNGKGGKRGGRDGGRGGRGGGGGRDRDGAAGGGRGGRPDRPRRDDQAPGAEAAGRENGGEGAVRQPRRPRPSRAPRPPGGDSATANAAAPGRPGGRPPGRDGGRPPGGGNRDRFQRGPNPNQKSRPNLPDANQRPLVIFTKNADGTLTTSTVMTPIGEVVKKKKQEAAPQVQPPKPSGGRVFGVVPKAKEAKSETPSGDQESK